MTSKYVLTGISALFVLTTLAACGGGGGGTAPAPNSTFTTQPTSVTVAAPATAAFNVIATGTPTPTLQWQLSTNGGGTWGDIVGATTSSYTTPATVIGDSVKLYRAVATNSTGVVNSNVASLTLRTIALPKTGQTTCSDAAGTTIACAGTGQDGELQTGVAEPSPRFTVDGTGNCITDNLTGLMWTRNANLPAALRSWQQALDDANALSLCGFTDWRLSNRNELRSLINYNLAANNATTLNTLGFNNVQADNYWSSTSIPSSTSVAWYVGMYDGRVQANIKVANHYVWPVRAGQ